MSDIARLPSYGQRLWVAHIGALHDALDASTAQGNTPPDLARMFELGLDTIFTTEAPDSDGGFVNAEVAGSTSMLPLEVSALEVAGDTIEAPFKRISVVQFMLRGPEGHYVRPEDRALGAHSGIYWTVGEEPPAVFADEHLPYELALSDPNALAPDVLRDGHVPSYGAADWILRHVSPDAVHLLTAEEQNAVVAAVREMPVDVDELRERFSQE